MALVEVSKTKIQIKNTLNELSSSDWLKFTRSWFLLRPKGRDGKVIHPASFPEELAENYIRFFTRSGDTVLDPMVGSGSTLIAARIAGRNAIGIELNNKYSTLSQQRLDSIKENNSKQLVINDDARNLADIFKKCNIPDCDFCITSPPYWNQLVNTGIKNTRDRSTSRTELNLDTNYGQNPKDLGLVMNYEQFLDEQEKIFDKVYDVMKIKSYLVVVTNNVYANGRMWPLAFDTLKRLSKKWVPKDEQIWCQDNRKLHPFGMLHTYVGNRSHHYCLIVRKE